MLEEEVDKDYEPTELEVFEYAQWLGMDVEQERVRSGSTDTFDGKSASCAQDLLWIAREGLKAPLPSSWKPW